MAAERRSTMDISRWLVFFLVVGLVDSYEYISATNKCK